MNQNNRHKTNHPETGAKFETGMDYYVPIGVILVELDSSNGNARIETKNFTENKINNLMDNLGEIKE
jgi:hypothetical protein